MQSIVKTNLENTKSAFQSFGFFYIFKCLFEIVITWLHFVTLKLFKFNKKIFQYLSIRYAKSPTATRRFKPPEPQDLCPNCNPINSNKSVEASTFRKFLVIFVELAGFDSF